MTAHALVSIELHAFTGPLDPAHKTRPNCVIFIFIWSWAAAATAVAAVPSLFTCFYLETERWRGIGGHVLRAAVG